MRESGQVWVVAVAAAGIAAAVAAGLALRLADPLANPVVPAEDPFTHMALVRAHVADGSLEPLNPGAGLYPPGMHAVLATTWLYTGLDLEGLARFGPAVLGAIGVLGVGLLLWRWEGRAAAIVGATAMAVMPEAVFRTSMLAPTALDLALLPFLLLAALEVLAGRLAWSIPLVLLAAFLLLAHPWLFGLLALAGVALLLLGLLAPWPAGRGPPVSALGLAVLVAVAGSATAFAAAGCWGACPPGFVTVAPEAGSLADAAPALLAASLAVGLLVAFARRPLQRAFDGASGRARPGRRLVVPALLAAFVALVAWTALSQGLPRYVDPVAMMGLPILAVAAVALVLLPRQGSPAAYAAGALVLATLPLVLHNPFDSPFWPHRTAAYLGVGLALLCGAFAGAVARWLDDGASPALQSPRVQRARRSPALAAAAPLLLAAVLGAGVVSATSAYEDGWYRLFSECEMEALKEVASRAQPGTTVVAGSWQAKLAIAAYSDDPGAIWFSSTYFTKPDVREGLRSRTVLAVADPHLPDAADPAFLREAPYQPVGAWCAQGGAPTIQAAIRSGASP